MNNAEGLYIIYQRFSPREQHGYAADGEANVIASLLAGAEEMTRPSSFINNIARDLLLNKFKVLDKSLAI
jgi:hypothetical protein